MDSIFCLELIRVRLAMPWPSRMVANLEKLERGRVRGAGHVMWLKLRFNEWTENSVQCSALTLWAIGVAFCST
jgi:hypothetical protein